MCGICGKIKFNGATLDPALITRMCRTLVHRGPDDEGVYTAPYVGLGQRRLSIIDLCRSACAPLHNEDKSVWIVFNGEIYNFQELRAELLGKGHIFLTNTDTEVIIHLYEECGIDCLRHLRGMFAFALWDANREILFGARDRLGKKPFFYTSTGSAFIFGSEIKAITADPEVSVSPNYQAIDRYLTYQYVPSPLSAFEKIYKLPPAHYLICKADGVINVQRYWQTSLAEKTKASQAEVEEELLRLLQEAVRLRMISDVPLGAFLSGGIDSSAVVALMAQESLQPVQTFTIGFEEEAYNELPQARLLAERYGTEHHEFMVKPAAAEVLPLLVRHYNEPFADSSALPTYYVSKMTRGQVTVALSGDGGDESFSGYDRYGTLMRWARADIMPALIRKMACFGPEALLAMMPYHNLTARFIRGFHMLAAGLRERYLLEMTSLKPQERQMAYTSHFKALSRTDSHPEDPLAAFPWDKSMDSLDWMMAHDQNFYLPDCLEVKMDIASMANSLEVRSPFLDHRLVEFAATIPSSMKRNGTGGKLILKHLMKGMLPEEVLNKPKTGFAVPVGKWFRTELADLLRGMLQDDRAAKRGLFEPAFINKMVSEHIDGQRDWTSRLWAFLFLEMWFREFID
jgi:asparagine synthase (glutamine-hydrolysing)